MANTVGTKETPVDYVARKRANALRLVDKFRRSMPEGYGQLEMDLLAYEEIEANEVDQVKRLAEKLLDLVTKGRVDQIRRLVERSVKAWEDGKYAVPFAATQISSLVDSWLETEPIHQHLDWVDDGWRLLKGDLEFPWGKCDCGVKLLPVLITDRKTGEKKWRVFDTCRSCHLREIEPTEPEPSFVKPAHKVAKPGSAAKRSHGPRPKKETPVKTDKKKKEGKEKK